MKYSDFSAGLITRFIGEKLKRGTLIRDQNWLAYEDKLEVAGGLEQEGTDASDNITDFFLTAGPSNEQIIYRIVGTNLEIQVSDGAWETTNITDLTDGATYSFVEYANTIGIFLFVIGEDQFLVTELATPDHFLKLDTEDALADAEIFNGYASLLDRRLYIRNTGENDKKIHVGAQDSETVRSSNTTISLFENPFQYEGWQELERQADGSYTAPASAQLYYRYDHVILVPRESYNITEIARVAGVPGYGNTDLALINYSGPSGIFQEGDYFLVEDVVGVEGNFSGDEINGSALQSVQHRPGQGNTVASNFVFDDVYSDYSSGGKIIRCDKYTEDRYGNILNADEEIVGYVNPLTNELEFTPDTQDAELRDSVTRSVSALEENVTTSTTYSGSFDLLDHDKEGYTLTALRIEVRSSNNLSSSNQDLVSVSVNGEVVSSAVTFLTVQGGGDSLPGATRFVNTTEYPVGVGKDIIDEYTVGDSQVDWEIVTGASTPSCNLQIFIHQTYRYNFNYSSHVIEEDETDVVGIEMTGSVDTWIEDTIDIPQIEGGFESVTVQMWSESYRNSTSEEAYLFVNNNWVYGNNSSAGYLDDTNTDHGGSTDYNYTDLDRFPKTITYLIPADAETLDIAVYSDGFDADYYIEFKFNYKTYSEKPISTEHYRYLIAGSNNIADFSYSTPKSAEDGFLEEYLAGGDPIVNMVSGDDRMYIVKERSIHSGYVDGEGLWNTELTRGNVLITSPKAVLYTSEGLIFLDRFTGKTVLQRLEKNVTGDYLVPNDLTPQLDLDAFDIDENTTLSFLYGYLALGCSLDDEPVTVLIDVANQRASVVHQPSYKTITKDEVVYTLQNAGIYKLLSGNSTAECEFTPDTLDTDEQKRFRKLYFRGVMPEGVNFTVKASFDDQAPVELTTITANTDIDEAETETNMLTERGDRRITAYDGSSDLYFIEREVRVRTPKFRTCKLILEASGYVAVYEIEPRNLIKFGRGNRLSSAKRT